MSAIVFWQCIMMNRLIVGQKILSTNSFYPALFYFLILSISPQEIYLSASLFALTFILLSLNKLLSCYLDKSAYTKIFDSAIFMSIAILIYPPFIVFCPIIWIGMSIFSQGEGRHWLISILGFMCPWIILYTLSEYLLIDSLNPSMFFNFLAESYVLSSFDFSEIMSLLALGILSLLALKEVAVGLSRKNIKARKSFVLFLWMLIMSVLYTLINPATLSTKLLVYSISLSPIISNYFYYQKNSKWLDFFGIILFATLLYNHISKL